MRKTCGPGWLGAQDLRHFVARLAPQGL